MEASVSLEARRASYLGHAEIVGSEPTPGILDVYHVPPAPTPFGVGRIVSVTALAVGRLVEALSTALLFTAIAGCALAALP